MTRQHPMNPGKLLISAAIESEFEQHRVALTTADRRTRCKSPREAPASDPARTVASCCASRWRRATATTSIALESFEAESVAAATAHSGKEMP